MGWDSARPVPWKRFLKEGLLFSVGMSAVMYVFAGERDPASFIGIVMGAVMYISVAGFLAKLGYVRTTLAEMRAEAASRPPRQTGKNTVAATSARPRPAPTSRTGGSQRGKRR
ncbi:MAG: hypothetical protein Q7V57_15290 [Actinomycetota bacterium]|nr:hypothetical protein [Actinomycetota bacterium]